MNEVETWLRMWSEHKNSSCWKYATPDEVSKSFIREFKDKFNWNKNTRKLLIEKHGKKFYEEIFGKEK